MNSFKQYLLRAQKKYPQNKLQDYLKQIYQSEFAGGHMIKSIDSSLNYLIEESKDLGDNTPILYEYISDNVIRINIKPFINNFDINILNNLFYESSLLEYSKKNIPTKCESLKEIINQNDAIDSFKNNPCAYHHSDTFRNTYNPHYRVINSSLLTTELRTKKLEQYIDSLPKETLTIIAVEGRCASGKSTITSNLKDITLIHADDFFSKTDVLDFDLLEQLIKKLKIGETINYTAYNCSNETYFTKTLENIKPIVIIEGVYSYHPKVRKYINRLVYFEVTKDLQINRLKNRTTNQFLYNKFINIWIPREEKYFSDNTYIIDADIII